MRRDRLAFVISAAFSPFIILTLFGVLAILAVPASPEETRFRIASYLLLPVGIPTAYLLWAFHTGRISDLHVAIREQRALPFMAATIGAALLAALFLVLQAPTPLVAFSLSLLACGLAFGVISAFWKISIHAAAFAGSLLMLALVSQDWRWLLAALFLPAIIWARHRRGRHSLAQGASAAVVVCGCIGGIFALV